MPDPDLRGWATAASLGSSTTSTGQVVQLRHALRNALLPVVTTIGLQLGILLGGAVITRLGGAVVGGGQERVC